MGAIGAMGAQFPVRSSSFPPVFSCLKLHSTTFFPVRAVRGPRPSTNPPVQTGFAMLPSMKIPVQTATFLLPQTHRPGRAARRLLCRAESAAATADVPLPRLPGSVQPGLMGVDGSDRAMGTHFQTALGHSSHSFPDSHRTLRLRLEPAAPPAKLSTATIAQTGRLPCYKREPRHRACTGSPKPKESRQ